MDIRGLKRKSVNDRLEFNKEINLDYIKVWGEMPFKTPVIVTGGLKALTDGYQIDYTVEYLCDMPCVRCLTQVERRFTSDFSHVIVEKASGSDDDFAVISRGKLDLTALVGADILLEMEESFLCRSDCRGICFTCGTDLNNSCCECSATKPQDPRFDVLREILGK